MPELHNDCMTEQICMLLKPLATPWSQAETLRFSDVAAEWDRVELPFKCGDVASFHKKLIAQLMGTQQMMQSPGPRRFLMQNVKSLMQLRSAAVKLNETRKARTIPADMLLCKCKKLFDGQLWHFQGQEAKLELKVACPQHTTMLCVDTQSWGHMSCRQNGCLEDGQPLRMGSANHCHSKERWINTTHIQFSCS